MDYSPWIIPLQIGPWSFSLSQTVITTWGIMITLVIFSLLAARRLERVPRGLQVLLEALVAGLADLAEGSLGPGGRNFTPFVGTLALYIGTANLMGLVGVRPPTADLNTTLALALVVFLSIHYYGIKAQGLGRYLGGFAQPFVFLLPINILGELATPISLAFRLFGNMLGAVIVMSLLYQAVPLLLPVLPHFYFDLFGGILQAFIFVMLTATFMGTARG